MATSMENFSISLGKSKSLLQDLHDKNNQHPSKENEIYATIKVPEILLGLTQEDFRKKDKEKALDFRKKLDDFTSEEGHRKEEELFMGMTD
jgi:hypothetical protein